MSEASDRSDVSRSARAYTTAPDSTRSNATTSDARRPSPTEGEQLTTIRTSTIRLQCEHERSEETTGGNSFSDDPRITSNLLPMNSSWDETHSVDDGEERYRPSSRSSSRTSLRDRRKQFDATTPTLIDEEDDSEIHSLERRLRQTSFGDKDDLLIRRTPGASMYRSSFEPTPEEAASMRKTPGAVTIHRSAGSLPEPISSTYLQSNNEDEQVGLGFGFGLTLSTPVGSSNANDPQDPPLRDRHRQIVWDTSHQTQSQSNSASPLSSSGLAGDTVEGSAVQPFQSVLGSSLAAASVAILRSSQDDEPRRPFSFASWGKGSGEDQSQHLTHATGEGRSNTSGAFSPNILRLTEDIGNLLHEDEDDDFALEIPSVFRGDQMEMIETNDDWTGSYVFDSEIGQRTSKPAVPSRSSTSGSNPLVQRDSRSRRRSGNSNINQQQYVSSGFPLNAQQPKPRMRSGNDVFEFGKSSHAESSQVLNFGGAFAPPAALIGNNPGYMRPLPFSGLHGDSTTHELHSGRGQAHNVHKQAHLIQQQSQVNISQLQNQGHAIQQQNQVHAIQQQNQVHAIQQQNQGHAVQQQNQGHAIQHQNHAHAIQHQNQAHANVMQHQNQAHAILQHNQAHAVQQQNQTSGLAQGNFQVGITGSSNTPGQFNSQTFDSYQHPADFSGTYFQPQSILYSSGAANTAYMMLNANAYNAQQSEMQATAREFVPRTTLPAGHYMVPPQQWQPQIQTSPIPHYESSLEQTNWHGPNVSYVFNGNYGYGLSQAQSFGDPRSNMTPSPHLQPWPQTSQPPQSQRHHTPPPQQLVQTPPPVVDPNMYYNPVPSNTRSAEIVLQQTAQNYRVTSSPHPSIAGSEHSQSTSQRSKKESKRKQRGKKKPSKVDSPGTAKKGVISSKKKGNKLDQARPGSTPHCNDGQDDPQVSASEDPHDSKRSELIESPATRAAFKEFYRTIRSEERLSFQKAEEYALLSLTDGSLPDSVHWKVYLELADLAKRSNRYVEARILYKKVCHLQPYASQGWLEYSKLEEECGHMNRVMNILHSGLEFCKYSESLLTRAVKHQEKMGNLATARELLARLKHVGIEKVWRTVLEGALLEARAGNVATARRVLKYLMYHVPWYGPLYLEAYRLEKDQGHPLDALQIVERGLQAIPRYGPLWFGAFRLCEDIDRSKKLYELPQTMDMIERAAISISKELVWKVHLEAAQMLERSAIERGNVTNPSFDRLLVPARRRLAMTILTCPNNLRWKVWLAAARMELGIGNTKRARSLFLRAHEVVPKKGRSTTLLESARLEDFIGDTNLARAVLCKGRLIYGHDWKVWLESVLLEIRSGNSARAIEICTYALDIHQGTGRLWATLVQLCQFSGRDEAQQIALGRALNAVPKSGEVWCEGGRIHLNPFSDTFDLARARRHLFFATRFTPQYGDGFVETIRLELIDQWLSPIAHDIWEKTKSSFQHSKDSRVESSLTKYITDVALAIAVASLKDTEKDVTKSSLPKLFYRSIVPAVRKRLKPEVLREAINLSDLRLACINADPNYGLLWFHCRRRPTDTPRRIIEDAAGDIAAELQKYAHIYLAAIIRRLAVLSTVESRKPAQIGEGLEVTDPETTKWNEYLDGKLLAAPSLEEIFNPIDPTTGLVLLENTVNGPLFVTGLSELNRHKPMSNLSLAERRRSLFGNDALFP